MISDEMRERIMPHLLDSLLEEDYPRVDEMFSETYYTNAEGIGRITLKPLHNDIAMQFNTINGSFVELTSWEYIQRVGEKI